MAQTLLSRISSLLGMGGNSQRINDAAMSSTSLVSMLSASGGSGPAFTDHGANIYTKGMFKVRFKSVGGFSTANAQVALVVSDTSAFTTRQVVSVFNPISPASGSVVAPSSISWVGEFDNDPTPFRYTRLENPGAVLGGTAITFDWEVLALP